MAASAPVQDGRRELNEDGAPERLRQTREGSSSDSILTELFEVSSGPTIYSLYVLFFLVHALVYMLRDRK